MDSEDKVAEFLQLDITPDLGGNVLGYFTDIIWDPLQCHLTEPDVDQTQDSVYASHSTSLKLRGWIPGGGNKKSVQNWYL